MTVSLPQAFLLMKLLQALDFYIYIDCKYPSNFAKFLDMITNSVFDYMPNFFGPLIDDQGSPLYERFAEYGMQVHMFANLGQIFSVVILVSAIKLVLYLISKVWNRGKTFNRLIGIDMFYGLFESNNLLAVLSIITFAA